MTPLRAQELTAAAFVPFGRVIERRGRQEDAAGPGWRWWGETLLLEANGRRYGVGYLELEPGALRFDWAERHMRSAELVIPTGDCVVYVGPPAHPDEPGRLPPLERFQAFRVRRGQGVVLEPGVWHGAPLALGEPANAVVLLLEGTGASDVHVVRFPATPVEIEGEV